MNPQIETLLQTPLEGLTGPLKWHLYEALGKLIDSTVTQILVAKRNGEKRPELEDLLKNLRDKWRSVLRSFNGNEHPQNILTTHS